MPYRCQMQNSLTKWCVCSITVKKKKDSFYSRPWTHPTLYTLWCCMWRILYQNTTKKSTLRREMWAALIVPSFGSKLKKRMNKGRRVISFFVQWIFYFGTKSFSMPEMKTCCSASVDQFWSLLVSLCDPLPCHSRYQNNLWHVDLYPFKERTEPEYEVPGKNSL